MIPVMLNYEREFDDILTNLFGNPHGPFMCTDYHVESRCAKIIGVDGRPYSVLKSSITPINLRQELDDLL